MTLANFLEALKETGADVDVEGTLDILWIARFLKEQKILQDDELPLPGQLPTIDGLPLQTAVAKPKAGPPPQPKTGEFHLPIVPRTHSPADSARGARASIATVPAAAALSGRLALSRALRTFGLKRQSMTISEVDEVGTVEASATLGFFCPVIKPSLERWFTVDLVLEDDPAIMVWRRTLEEFRTLLRDSGVFQDVRLWHLERSVSEKDPKSVQFVLRSPEGGRVSSQFVAGTGVQRLVLFATHGSSSSWADGSYQILLEKWIPTTSVALMNLLPPRDWKRSALGAPQGVCRASYPGSFTANLDGKAFWWSDPSEESTSFVPVFPLEARAISAFAQMQMGRGESCPIIYLDSSRSISEEDHADGREADFRKIISALSETSPDAFKLATYLCLGPFTLPVARLIQETKFGANPPQYMLAEVLLSGLVSRCHSVEDGSDPEVTRFDFHPHARELLLRSLRRSDVELMASELDLQISSYLKKVASRTNRNAVLFPDDSGVEKLPADMKAFAHLRSSLPNAIPSRTELQKRMAVFIRTVAPERRESAIQFVRKYGRTQMDEHSVPKDIFDALRKSDLVSRTSDGEWRLRPGVDSQVASSEDASEVAFAIIIEDEHSVTNGFRSWLDDNGLAAANVYRPTQLRELAATVGAVLSAANGQGRVRRLYVYYRGEMVVTDDLLLSPSRYSDDATVSFRELLATSANSGVFHELIFVIDGTGVPLRGVSSLILPALAYPPGGPDPSIAVIARDGYSHPSFGDNALTNEVLNGLRGEAITLEGTVTRSSLEEFLLDRLGSEVRIETSGPDFVLTHLPRRSAYSEPIQRVLIVGGMPFGQGVPNAAKPGARPRAFGSVVERSKRQVGPIEIATITLDRRDAYEKAFLDFSPHAVISLGAAQPVSGVTPGDIVVSTSVAYDGSVSEPSPEMLGAVRRVSMDWPKRFASGTKTRTQIVYGRIEGRPVEGSPGSLRGPIAADANLRRVAGPLALHPEIHWLMIRLVEAPNSKNLYELASLTTDFAFEVVGVLGAGMITSVTPSEPTPKPTSRRPDSRQRLEAALAQLRSQSDAMPGNVGVRRRELSRIQKSVGTSPPNDRYWEWIDVQRMLGEAYGRLDDPKNLLTDRQQALQHFSFAMAGLQGMRDKRGYAAASKRYGELSLELATRTRSSTYAKTSIDSLSHALEIFERAGMQTEAAQLPTQLQTAKDLLQSLGSGVPKPRAPKKPTGSVRSSLSTMGRVAKPSARKKSSSSKKTSKKSSVRKALRKKKK
jgi:hypothetical protein